MATFHCARCPQLVERKLLAKQREAVSEGVTAVDDVTEVSEELVGASSDQLDQVGSGVLQVKEEDEEDGLSEEETAEQVCEPVHMQLYGNLFTQHAHTSSTNHTYMY